MFHLELSIPSQLAVETACPKPRYSKPIKVEFSCAFPLLSDNYVLLYIFVTLKNLVVGYN